MLFCANINVFSCPVSSNVNSEPRSSNGNVVNEPTGDDVVDNGGCVTDGRTVLAFDELMVVDCWIGGNVTVEKKILNLVFR